MAKHKEKEQQEQQKNEEAAVEAAEQRPEEAPAEVEEGTPEGEALEEAVEALSPEEVAALREELQQARAEAEGNLDGWQRAQAEFANYRKRLERDHTQRQLEITADIVRRYLEVTDDLERALKNRPDGGEGAEWAQGVELIYRKMLAVLENEGVEPMEIAPGEEFDPNYHEAISNEENDEHESGQIIEVVQPGYLIKDRVLRPARVRVAK